MDVLDIEKNIFTTGLLREIDTVPELIPYLDLVATRNLELEAGMRNRSQGDVFSWVLTFDNLLKKEISPPLEGGD